MATTNSYLLQSALNNLRGIDNAENNWLMEGQVYRHHLRRYCVSDSLNWLKSYVTEFNDFAKTMYRAREFALSCRADHVLTTDFNDVQKRLTIIFTDRSRAILTSNGPFLQVCWQRRSSNVRYVFGTFKVVHRRYEHTAYHCASLVRIF